MLKSLDKDILVNNLDFVWNLLQKKDSNDINIIDIILDNAGYEFFTDLCLAAFLIATKLAEKIRFYVKHYPWYISDTTTNDFNWTLTYMQNSPNESIQELANYLKNNVWTIEVILVISFFLFFFFFLSISNNYYTINILYICYLGRTILDKSL